MTIDKIQRLGFTHTSLPCFHPQTEIFFEGSIEKLSFINFPAFIVFSQKEYLDDFKQEFVHNYLTALYYDSSKCEEAPTLPEEATHIFVLSEFELTQEMADRYFRTLYYCTKIKLKYPISDRYKYNSKSPD